MDNGANHTLFTLIPIHTHPYTTAPVRPTAASIMATTAYSSSSSSSSSLLPSSPSAPHYGQSKIPTSALGPVTISVLVGLVLITCLILQFSKVRQKLASRRLVRQLRREARERQQLFEYQQLPSAQGSWISEKGSHPPVEHQRIDQPRPALTRYSTSKSSSEYSFSHKSSLQYPISLPQPIHR